MSDAEAYLRELRRALPIGCRRRFVAEMREHFASAIAAEAESGVGRAEAERLTIERLGPADALALQVRADLRSGALGRLGNVTARLSTTRVLAAATAVIAIVTSGAVFAVTHSSRTPAKPQRAAGPTVARPTVTVDPRTGEVRMVMYAVQAAIQAHQNSITLRLKPMTFYRVPARPKH
jgi:hypothetical protein